MGGLLYGPLFSQTLIGTLNKVPTSHSYRYPAHKNKVHGYLEVGLWVLIEYSDKGYPTDNPTLGSPATILY